MGVSDNVLCITEIISLFPSVVPSHTVLGFTDVKEGRSKRKMMRNRNKTGNKYRIKESKKKKGCAFDKSKKEPCLLLL